jgi:hypothetical protein
MSSAKQFTLKEVKEHLEATQSDLLLSIHEREKLQKQLTEQSELKREFRNANRRMEFIMDKFKEENDKLKEENFLLKQNLAMAHQNADAVEHAENAGIVLAENDRLQEENANLKEQLEEAERELGRWARREGRTSNYREK